MKAVIMTRPGGPEVLHMQETATPHIHRPHELLVRIKAAGINPVDTKLRSKSTYYPDRTPTILGCDAAGVVEDIGDAVRRFRPGDAVYFCHGGIGGANGNYAEFASVDERYVAHKPAQLDFVQAAAAPLVLITAWEALHDRARITSGQRVLIHAGAGGVGHIAIQLAKEAGAQVCSTVGSADKAKLIEALGADLAILYRQHDFVEAVMEWTADAGVDIGFDTVGGKTFENTAAAIRVYGDLVTLLQPGADTDWTHIRLRNLRVSLELMLSPMYYQLESALQHQAWILERGAELFDSGRLQIRVQQTFALAEAAEAHRLLERGSLHGKLVLVP